MSELDPRDAILQAHTPAVMVPRYGKLPPLEKSGHRYLVANDGLWLEVRRPWLHARVPLATIGDDDHALPFGSLEPVVTYGFDEKTIYALATRFFLDARERLPDEFAAWGVWDESDGRLKYKVPIQLHSSSAGIRYARPRLEAHHHLAVDLHSHGKLAAFFSATDDQDDAGEVKIAIVAGTIDKEPTWDVRLCLLGRFLSLDGELA